MSKEPTRHQLSSKLAYQGRTPAFLQRMQNRINGTRDEDEDDEYEDDGSGRPPIPKRPPIPERPDDEPGSAEEDNDDEAPQIVVLKEGKHLSGREVENEKRRAKGLSPLPEGGEAAPQKETEPSAQPKDSKKASTQGLSFSSSGSTTKPSTKKRKAVGSVEGDEPGPHKTSAKKKSKKDQKKLLSFNDDA